MNIYTTTIIMESPESLQYATWNRCISEAAEKYRELTLQNVRSVRFCVKGEGE